MALYYFLDPARKPVTISLTIFAVLISIVAVRDSDWIYLAGLVAPVAYFGGMPFNASWRYTREEFNQLKQNRQNKQSND